MNSIISYLLWYNQYLFQIISYLCKFICRFIPLKQFAFDDSMSPKYQKLKIDKLPVIIEPVKQDYSFLLEYYRKRYSKSLKPVNRRNGSSVPDSVVCPFCGAPHEYIYDNNGGKGQYQCKFCHHTFHDNDKDISLQNDLVLIKMYIFQKLALCRKTHCFGQYSAVFGDNCTDRKIKIILNIHYICIRTPVYLQFLKAVQYQPLPIHLP